MSSAGLPQTIDDSLARARAGEPAAFAELVRLHQRSVYTLALRLLNRREPAEDLAQETFLRLYHKLASIESASHLGFWLRRVVTNLAIDRLRMDRHVTTIPFDEDAHAMPAPNGGDLLLQRQLLRLVAALPPDPRAVMLLRYQEDQDPFDIARMLDMPVNTVKSHLRRSLALLREQVIGAVPAGREELRDD